MRVATFNILHGMSVLGRNGTPTFDPGDQLPADPEALAAAVRSIDADVLGMQEVDAHQERSGSVDQALVAAHAMGIDGEPAPRMFIPSVQGTPGDRATFSAADEHVRRRASEGPEPHHGPLYGVALVTRLEVVSWHHTVFDAAPMSLPLLVPSTPKPRLMSVPDEPRAAIAAVLAVGGREVTVATVHLSFVPGFNAAQLRRLVAWLKPLPRPLVLLGDFNLPGGFPELITGWPGIVRAQTYPSFGPKVRFDHILLDGFSKDAVLEARRTVEVLRLDVSDHCAVAAELPL